MSTRLAAGRLHLHLLQAACAVQGARKGLHRRIGLAGSSVGAFAVLVIINIFYFTNILPPLPLAAKAAGVYHSVVREGEALIFKPRTESRRARMQWGTARNLASNVVRGVSDGFTINLEINGVGYKAEIKGPKIVLSLGYSHPIVFQLPKGITAKMEKNLMTLAGSDRELLGQTAAKIRSFRPPEPYKGKGIKYDGEFIFRKEGKKK